MQTLYHCETDGSLWLRLYAGVQQMPDDLTTGSAPNQCPIITDNIVAVANLAAYTFISRLLARTQTNKHSCTLRPQ